MADIQASLLTVDPSAPSSRRTTSKGIGPGDIVEIDKRGRRFHALVTRARTTRLRPLRAQGPPTRLPHLLAHRHASAK